MALKWTFRWKYEEKEHEAELVPLCDHDKELFRVVGLEEDEFLIRYRTGKTMVGKMTPLIKINRAKMLVYFLTERGIEQDMALFEKRGCKITYLNAEGVENE